MFVVGQFDFVMADALVNSMVHGLLHQVESTTTNVGEVGCQEDATECGLRHFAFEVGTSTKTEKPGPFFVPSLLEGFGIVGGVVV